MNIFIIIRMNLLIIQLVMKMYLLEVDNKIHFNDNSKLN